MQSGISPHANVAPPPPLPEKDELAPIDKRLKKSENKEI